MNEYGKIKIIALLAEENPGFAVETHLYGPTYTVGVVIIHINPLNAELNSICHLLVLLGAHHILHVSRVRVNGGVKLKAV